MLLLSRKINESVMIGDEIEVIVINITASKVMIGFRAPKNISIHREEVYMKILHSSCSDTETRDPAVNPISGDK